MKWIGQHIYDFISRFRNDVYLEDISTGTIASGGNLGLDSNNKIVKAAEVGSSVDLTSEVSGILPVANGGTGASSLTDNSVLTGTGGSPITAEANFTYTGTALAVQAVTSTFSHGTSSNIVVTNTGDNDAGGNLLLRNERNSGSTANSDGDILGIIQFEGHNDAGTPADVPYAQIKATAPDVSDGAEEGKLELSVSSHDAEMQPGLVIQSGDAEDEVDVTIGNGDTSLTTIKGTLTMGSTAFVNNSGVVQVATQGTIDHDSLANFVANEHIDWTGDVSASSVIHTNNITDLHGAGVDGSANQLLTDDGDGTVTSESSFTYSTSFGQSLVIAGSLPQFSMRNTADDANGSTITLSNFRGTSLSALSANDTLGSIVFMGGDAGGSLTNYANIKGDVSSPTATDEAGRLYLQAATSNGTTTALQTGIQLTGDATSNEVDISIGFGAASVTTVNGNLLVEGVTQFNGQLEIGNASDTTLVRSSGGTLTVEGNTVVTAGASNVASESQAPIAMMHARRTITKAEANSMHSTPIEIIPAQGANTIIVPHECILRVDRALTQAVSSCNLHVHYADLEPGTYGDTTLMYIRRFMYNESGDRVVQAFGGSFSGHHNVQNLTDDINHAVEMSFSAAATLNCFTAIDVHMIYHVISIA
tara:strand:- start:282 stop:2222 length:1941 start_codon:yes stop_codon:yes gene_type:complete